jgi:hypothetical protein
MNYDNYDSDVAIEGGYLTGNFNFFQCRSTVRSWW